MSDNEWSISDDFGVINTPFNLEEILVACPKLYEKWKQEPFFFDINEEGRVVVVYVRLPDDCALHFPTNGS